MSWGLWKKHKKKWVAMPYSDEPLTFATRREAQAAMTRMTAGKRDPMTNYFRISTAPRRR